MVSIIVPVYNAEKYLEKCINSVLNQSFKCFELILINDGSTDNSGNLCDEYSKKDPRVKVIHQTNSGPSIARNTGINNAVGKYIQFVDSDDTISFDMTEKLVKAINEDIQLVICGYNLINNHKNNSYIQQVTPSIIGVYHKKQLIDRFGEFYNNYLINPLWNKLFNVELLKEFDIWFIEDLKMGEDLLFNLEYIKVCNNINIINNHYYNYLVINNNSLTSSFQKDLYENQKMLFERVKKFLIENDSFNFENKYMVENEYIGSIVNCLENLFHQNSDMSLKQTKTQINKMINDDILGGNIDYFENGDIQKRIIGLMIKYRFTHGIICFFKFKNTLRSYVRPLFNLFKMIKF
ncbi:glycosyltransferase [Pradoshia sp. D12]|nr:glycosyltransferase [Pradoshia sp. D12]TPF72170.1 glycosyltransferase [Bacillus sp. D12]